MALVRIGGSGLKEHQEKNKVIKTLEDENAEFLFKSAMAEMKVEALQDDISELMIKVAMIEMGGNI